MKSLSSLTLWLSQPLTSLKAIVDELNIHDTPIATFKNFFNVETAKYSWNLKVKAIYDSDDEGEGEYTVERFKKDLNRVGKKEKNDDDKEYIVREYHIGVNSRKANTSVNVAFMQTGEMFGSFGTITKPINEDGILVTEDDYGYKVLHQSFSMLRTSPHSIEESCAIKHKTSTPK